MTDHTKALADFHAFFRDRCEALFATFGPEAIALYNAAGAPSLTVGERESQLIKENERLHRQNAALLAAKQLAEQRERETEERARAALAPAAQAEPVSAKHAALMLCYELEKQPASSYQTAAVLAAFKVYRAFESIEKHGEIRQWVFDVAPSNPPAQGKEQP